MKVIEPIEKKLVCGDIGKGAMQSIDYICDVIEHLVAEMRQIILKNQ
jgi:phosphopantothenoylcysteine synthetase/decarboxylase